MLPSPAPFVLQTKIDQFVQLVRSERRGLEQLTRELRMSPIALETLAGLMEQAGVVQIDYPLNVMEKPQVVFVQLPAEPHKTMSDEEPALGRLIETYTFKADDVPATVEIRDSGRERMYHVSLVE